MPSRRGLAVDHSFRNPVNLSSQSGRVIKIALAQETLYEFVEESSTKHCCTFLTTLYVFIALAKIIAGIYIDECPEQKQIPIYLLVAGCMGIMHLIIPFVLSEHVIILVLLRFLTLIWFFLGSYWIFNSYDHLYNAEENICNKYLYRFAFWVTFGDYLGILILIVYMCILCYIQ